MIKEEAHAKREKAIEQAVADGSLNDSEKQKRIEDFMLIEGDDEDGKFDLYNFRGDVDWEATVDEARKR
jgi:hypothetical protein